MLGRLVQKLRKSKGFTLIELIIVVAIIAILVGLAIPKLMHVQQDSKIKTDIANAKTIANAAATLITQDKITLTNGSATVTLKKTIASDPDSNTKELSNYLQTIPIPKAVSNQNFTVKVQQEVASKAESETGKKDGIEAKEAKISVEVNNKEIYPGDPGNYGK